MDPSNYPLNVFFSSHKTQTRGSMKTLWMILGISLMSVKHLYNPGISKDRPTRPHRIHSNLCSPEKTKSMQQS